MQFKIFLSVVKREVKNRWFCVVNIWRFYKINSNPNYGQRYQIGNYYFKNNCL